MVHDFFGVTNNQLSRAKISGKELVDTSFSPAHDDLLEESRDLFFATVDFS